MKPRVAVHFFGVRHYAGEVGSAASSFSFSVVLVLVFSSDAPLWLVAGGVRREGDAGEEQRHFQGRHPQPAEGEQVSGSVSSLRRNLWQPSSLDYNALLKSTCTNVTETRNNREIKVLILTILLDKYESQTDTDFWDYLTEDHFFHFP